MSKPNTHILVSLLTITIGLALSGCESAAEPPIQLGGNYAPVTAEQLRQTEFSHRTGAEEFSFDWTFERDTFLIEGDVPPDLIAAMLGSNASASRIDGTWQIRNGTIDFLVNIGGADNKQHKCSLPIYFTGVIRIETPEAQYVF